MAELALAIIPIGLKVCSGLVSYLSGLKDRDDTLARLTRQAESLEGCFQLLDVSLKQGHLDPTRYRAVSHIIVCLKNCEEGLINLKEFEQIQKSQNRLEHSLQKLRFPLRKAHFEELESILDRLCEPLSLAIQNLQLLVSQEIDLANSSALSLNTTNIQQATNAVSNLHTAVGGLTVPVNTIQSSLPLLQDSVDNLIPQIIPQINLVIESRLQAQTENIRQALQEAEVAAIRRHNATNELLSQLTTPSDGRVSVVAKLASKPSAIAELDSYISTCSCVARKSSTAQTYHLGSFLFADNTVTIKSHKEGCPLYVAKLKSSRRRNLSFTGIIKSLNCAIQLTFRTKTGAGGFAINPSLMYFGVVDRYTAPAFQVLNQLRQGRVHEPQRTDLNICLKAVLRKLQEVFGSGRARPTDVDQYGKSLLHVLSLKMNRRFPTELGGIGPSPDLEALFDFLIDIGTPVDLTCSTGETALHIAASQFAVSASVLGRLCFEDADIYTPTQLPWFVGNDVLFKKIAEYDRENKRVTEALYGPLTQAIIHCDEEQVKRLIDESLERLEESNMHGTNALYFAIERPEILKLIASRVKPIQLSRWNLLLSHKLSPLGRAMEISGTICNSQDGNAESRCPCVVAVNILLDANYPITPATDFTRGPYMKNLFTNASNHCKVLIAQMLRSDRLHLRDLARQRLLKTECSFIDSSVGELDFYAIELEQMLHRKHLTRFGRSSTIVHDDIGHISREMPTHEPVYLFLQSAEDASIFFNLGFRDFDIPQVYLGTNNGYSTLTQDFMSYVSPQYAMWLHKHLPRLWEWASRCSNLEGVDFILADTTGRYMCRQIYFSEYSGLSETLVAVIEVLEDEAADDCSCLCAARGCSSFDVIAKWLAVSGRKPTDTIALLLKHHESLLRPSQLTCLVRQVTFEALGMKHTCFDAPKLDEYGLPCLVGETAREEEEEACDDDHEKAVYLDELFTEFEDFLLSRSESLEHELTGGPTISTARSDDEDAASRALVFWNNIWPHRVEEIKKKLEATWDPDLQILNDLNVSLWFEEDEEHVAPKTLEEDHAGFLEDFMAKLEKI
ncbi:hypothetical protein LB507_009385 [Fusarium sp. FIESC RH6]|nr:hypothetical protein LB507_009385 [Fusarium sp. FIESC RH6]